MLVKGLHFIFGASGTFTDLTHLARNSTWVSHVLLGPVSVCYLLTPGFKPNDQMSSLEETVGELYKHEGGRVIISCTRLLGVFMACLITYLKLHPV